jgi:hypothetical protein
MAVQIHHTSTVRMPATTESLLASVSFPRTGKRGVPQQFPRRLYEMLHSETPRHLDQPNLSTVIGWSDSGTAFRIYDAAEFAASVLPQYFRTKKFSSFQVSRRDGKISFCCNESALTCLLFMLQRNLNLYGFTKVRRGPDTDMYAHPSFLRDRPLQLLELRKNTNSTRKSPTPLDSERPVSLRSVSPTNSPANSVASSSSTNIVTPIGTNQMVIQSVPSWAFVHKTLMPALTQGLTTYRASKPRKIEEDRGNLDLLALAMEKHTGR